MTRRVHDPPPVLTAPSVFFGMSRSREGNVTHTPTPSRTTLNAPLPMVNAIYLRAEAACRWAIVITIWERTYPLFSPSGRDREDSVIFEGKYVGGFPTSTRLNVSSLGWPEQFETVLDETLKISHRPTGFRSANIFSIFF